MMILLALVLPATLLGLPESETPGAAQMNMNMRWSSDADWTDLSSDDWTLSSDDWSDDSDWTDVGSSDDEVPTATLIPTPSLRPTVHPKPDDSVYNKDHDSYCEVPLLPNGYLIDNTAPIPVGASRKIRCNAGFCLADSKDNDLPPPSDVFLCTEQMAVSDVYCHVPRCIEDICDIITDNVTVSARPERSLGSSSKVETVTSILESGHGDYEIRWNQKWEIRALDYLSPKVGLNSRSLDEDDDFEDNADFEDIRLKDVQMKRVLRYVEGAGLCSRHLAGQYFAKWGGQLEAVFRGGRAGCAISEGTDNVIACIVSNF